VLELEGDFYGAVDKYLKAIELDSESISARFCLAFLYDRYDMFDEAIAQYKLILEREIYHAKSLLNLSNLYIQLGNIWDAIDYFKRLIQLMPENNDIWNTLGELYILGEYNKDAAVAFEKSLSINPFQESINIALAQIQYDTYITQSNGLKKADIARRIQFALSLNPENQIGKELLKKLKVNTGR